MIGCVLYQSLLPSLFGAVFLLEAPAGQDVPASPGTAVVNFPEGGELRVFVDYVGRTLGVRFVYGDELKGQTIELRPSPVEIPKDRLLPMLAGLLRVHDLAMVEVSPNVYRIVRAEQSSRSVAAFLPQGHPPDPASLRMVTQVLRVPTAKVETLAQSLAKFTSSARSELISVPERGLIIVTDYESRVALMKTILDALDAARPDVTMASVDVGGVDAASLASQVTAVLAEVYKKAAPGETPPTLRGDLLSRAIVVIGSQRQIDEARQLIDRLRPAEAQRTQRVYALTYLSVDRAKALIEKRLFASAITPAAVHLDADAPSNRLFITADPDTHALIEAVLTQEDLPLPQAQRPLRIYRPQNRKAADLLATLSQLLGQGAEFAVEPVASPQSTSSRAKDERPSSVTPPAQEKVQTPLVPPVPPVPPEVEAAMARQAARVQGPDYLLVEDEATNAILALGTPEFHAQLESLIQELDRRRPQVLIEMTLVAVTASDTLDLGFELESHDLKGAWDYLVFTSFGLSEIDVATGQRMLLPGLGGSGVLISPENIPILLRTLATHGLAKVISTPKILVSDNAKGMLRNVDEAPFTSVNASDTVATTSFAGFESAGTTLSVTPHIQEGALISLEYELSFSNFTGSSSNAAIPPPRTTNSFSSTVEVPDGYAVVTGGLDVTNHSDTVSEIPFIGRIPGLGLLFQNNARRKTQTRIFAFLRPVILRDDEFEALKFISLKEQEKAEVLPDDAPPSKPLWMR
ncbi:MAG: hypothetical protein L6Q93_04210 [Phycisphaerae bacterium]|nr:hypothetical protein [Phycisphaerae bacterium]